MIPNPWILLALVVGWLASLVGVGYWQRTDGRQVERSAWEQRESAELRSANATITALEEDARKKEGDHAAAVAVISTNYEEQLKNANDRAKADRAAVRAGSLRLYDPSAAGLRACGSIVGQTGTATAGRDGPAPGELSPEASGFLLDLENESDAIVKQLGAAQEVIRADRATCGMN